MMAEMICHKCNNRMRVDFRREFTKVRCDQCNTMLERDVPVDKEAAGRKTCESEAPSEAR